jgi:hypothetical protein
MAGTVSIASSRTYGRHGRLVIDCTADASDGSFPDTVLSNPDADASGVMHGWLLAMDTNPGATGPTADYDIKIENAEGVDILGGAGADRHTSNSERAYPLSGTAVVAAPVDRHDKLTLKITNNSENSATTRIVLYWVRADAPGDIR